MSEDDVIQIATGSYHVCALLEHGSVRCWGLGAEGRLGYGNERNVGDRMLSLPYNAGDVNISVESKVVQICAGSGHTCALPDQRSALLGIRRLWAAWIRKF